jgi:hypothetical protein
MNKDLLRHTVVLVQLQFPIEMKDRMHVQDLDKLFAYGQDDLLQLASATKEMLAEPEFDYHFLRSALIY